MNKRILWLRISFWTGALIDALAAVQMLVPAVFAITNQLVDFHPGPEYRYAMGMGAALMLGWTVLLVWADRKPLQRRGILLITVVPVIAGIVINELWAVGTRFLSPSAVAPVWVLQTALILLFGFSYWNAGKVDRAETTPGGT